jgi:protein-S-isoprenylcysteine O-methyltransferase Ste14
VSRPPMAGDQDSPGVVVLPPLLYGGVFIAALLLRWIRPLPMVPAWAALWPGIVLALLGMGIMVVGRRAMESVGTNVNPMLPTTAIVTSGLFRFTRNPLYVGMTILYVGLTLAFNTWWGAILLAPVLVVMHSGVILREERYLERKFGAAYREYRSKVRRYL